MTETNVAWVLDRLKAGAEFRTYGGRYYYTFTWRDGKLVNTIFDEGITTEEDATIEQLAKAIADNPECFPRMG